MQIVNYPHPVLRFKTLPVTRVNNDLKYCAKQMLDIMEEEDGIGLAANQVGLPLQMITIRWNDGANFCFVNPTIKLMGPMVSKREGCLSFPDITISVKRRSKCHFQAWTLGGDEVNQVVDSDLARVLQHECDHLNGILFTDRMSDTDRTNKALMRSLTQMEQAYHRYPKPFPIGDFNAILTEYCGVENPDGLKTRIP